jgi:hypothetical protein
MSRKLRGFLFSIGVLVVLILAVLGVASIPQILSNEAAVPPTQATVLPAPTNTLAAGECQKSGTVAWHADNQVSGAVYGEAPIGGLSETCWIVAQTWWRADGTTPMRAVFAVRPHSVVWLQGHLGGTGWYLAGDETAIRANLAEQSHQLEERDGPMPTILIVLPDDHSSSFPLVTRTMSR